MDEPSTTLPSLQFPGLLCFGAGLFNLIVPFGRISFLGVTFTVVSSSEPTGALESAIAPINIYSSYTISQHRGTSPFNPAAAGGAHAQLGGKHTPFFVSAIIVQLPIILFAKKCITPASCSLHNPSSLFRAPASIDVLTSRGCASPTGVVVWLSPCCGGALVAGRAVARDEFANDAQGTAGAVRDRWMVYR